MFFERPNDFNISLKKAVDVLRGNDDLLRNSKETFLKREKFKLQALINQDPDHTEFLYQIANGRNVSATFEKLHREVLDLQFANKRSDRFEPVGFYAAKSSKEITFKTTTGKFHSKILLKLSLHRSIAFPDAPPVECIQMRINRKIPPSTKLKDSFDQFMNGGGLLIDFIMDSLWPAIIKADELRKEEKLKQEETLKREQERKSKFTKNPGASQISAEYNRGPGRKSENNKDNQENRRDHHRDNYHSNRKKEEHVTNDRGVRIPRHNSQSGPPRNSRGPMYQQQPPVQHPIISSLMDAYPSRGPIGGSFGNHRRDNNYPMANNDYQGHRPEQQPTRFDSHRRGSKPRGSSRRGSENHNWRGE